MQNLGEHSGSYCLLINDDILKSCGSIEASLPFLLGGLFLPEP